MSLRFFKDRHWLFTEFPELAPDYQSGVERVYPENTEILPQKAKQTPQTSLLNRRIFEIGCGVGNTILPILTYSREKSLKVFGCDFSATAIDILKENAAFDVQRCEVYIKTFTINDNLLIFSIIRLGSCWTLQSTSGPYLLKRLA